MHAIIGNGPLGLAVMDELLALGAKVRVVNRRGMDNAPAGVEVFPADASDPAQAAKACEGAVVVYHCANPPYTQWPELFPPLTNSTIAAASKAGARLVFGDNLYAYGPSTQPMTEDLPRSAEGKKGKVRAQMEADLLAAHRRGEVAVAIAKASDFYGPRALTSSMGNRVFPNLLKGKAASIIGDAAIPHTYTYIRDFAKALVILGREPQAVGEVWHVPSAETLTTGEFIQRAAAQAGSSAKISTMPKWMMNTLSLFVPILGELKETLYQFEQPFIVDAGKFTAAFGDISTPLDQALAETLEWYRTQA